KTLALPCEQRRIKLKWTGKTAELVELIYGISVMGSVNDGTIQLKELVEELFNFFGIENTKGCYRIYNDIKMRKSDSRTYYLDSMRAELNHKMREEDKRFR
ncbi:MAG: Tetracycline regulation of excision, RteC, partial [bacterium P3]